jgi:hypothetical protein
LDDPNSAMGNDSVAVRKLIARRRRDARKKVLWLGYPVLVRHARSRSGWEGAFVEPLLVWPQDPDSGDFAFMPEPMLNTSAIRGLNGSENSLEEAAKLAEELSLDSQDLPPLDELVARLREIRQEWSWKEPLLPTPVRREGELRRLTEPGIYNAAITVLADRSPFTVGLERELAELESVTDGSIENSSLGVLLGKSRAPVEDDTLLLEAAPLNAEQRSAVRDALTAPLTVITGPPGTGKSQVVSAILVNAAWRGLRVLFASKNNKAVDVVLERVNGLASRPTVLRLGTRALQKQLAQHLNSILSSRPTEDDRRAYGETLSRLKRQGETLHGKRREYEEIIQFRNQADRLEQAAESARKLLTEAHFNKAKALLVSDIL